MLSNLYITSRINQTWRYSGIDSAEQCIDAQHFHSYPFHIEYNYNSRGFRDTEWPNNLSECVWCIGDSFTVGLGSPIDHIWPKQLEQKIHKKTINISMDGASNNWIARRFVDIKQQVNPKHTVICWSYSHRRETQWKKVQSKVLEQTYENLSSLYNSIKVLDWPTIQSLDEFNALPNYIRKEVVSHSVDKQFIFDNDNKLMLDAISDDELRRLHHSKTDDLANFANCLQIVEHAKKNTNLIHAVIPDFCPQKDLEQYRQELEKHNFIGETHVRDLARDGHHFDILTASDIADRMAKFI